MKMIRGSATIETIYIMATFMLVFVVLLRSLFYEHDKAIISGALYEAVTVTARKRQMDSKFSEADGISFANERMRNKLLYFSTTDISLTFSDEEIYAEAVGGHNSSSVSVSKRFTITYPERKLRRMKGLQQKGEDLLE